MKKWKRHGIVISPPSSSDWWHSHAMLPTPLRIDDSIYRIYFAGRNKNNQSSIGFVVIDLREPSKIIETSSSPVLKPGRLGTFDDNGVLPSCFMRKDDTIFMFTIGFKPGGTTRMDLYGGLTESGDGRQFTRWSEAPILERNRVNPFINTAPWVIKIGRLYYMYYVGGVEWINPDLPRYNIQLAISNDGFEWKRDGKIVIDFEHNENALARPYVINENNEYRMWFSAKGKSYRACYATSQDGINWDRNNKDFKFNGLSPGVDDEMVCYPAVISYRGQHFMFYNGNGYGVGGICLATEE